MKDGGYQTALIGNWHLGNGGIHDPSGFDYWNIFPDQGEYHNPDMREMGATEPKVYKGYATELIKDMSLNWLNKRDKEKPFMLMLHHKAPYRPWIPDEKHMHMYEDIDIPEPETFNDDYSNRAAAAKEATMRIGRDLTPNDLKMDPPEGLTGAELKSWKYQRYIYQRLSSSSCFCG